ncbi:MAG TPA: hypothetical protein VJ694_00975 [Patescibacteria group bacterium]|nr:hypothetical protein [Patescibacteria group bacterium]
MLENLVPSNRKYSDDPAEQAFCAFTERRALKLGSRLVTLISTGRCARLTDLQDFVWEQALDFVAPLEPSDRDELTRAKTGLPWAGRLDVELYWRLMYAAHVEKLIDANALGSDVPSMRRPLKQVVSSTALLVGQLVKADGGHDADFLSALSAPGTTAIGRALYQGVIERAGDEIRLRTRAPRAPKLLEPAVRVLAESVPAVVEGYDFDGRLIVSRETPPAASGSLVWNLDAKSGRWNAVAWPWQVEPFA